jgi:hypothetical protein
MRVGRHGRWLLAAGGFAAALMLLAVTALLVDRDNRIGLWLGNRGGKPAEWAAALAYRSTPLQRRAARRAAETYNGAPVCLGQVGNVDLDRDGFATDFIARYVDAATLARVAPEMSCKAYAARTHADALAAPQKHERFLIAKGIGLTHLVLNSFGGFDDLEARNGLVIGSNLQASPPNSTIFGFENGALTEVRRFVRTQAPAGSDAAPEIFDVLDTPRGLRLRVPEGLFDIAWNPALAVYEVLPLDWKTLIADRQKVLYVRRPAGALAVDAKLMLNDKVIAGSNDRGRTKKIALEPTDRLIFDPACRAVSGFRQMADLLGAVMVDAAVEEHVFECVLYPSARVKVQVSNQP